MMTAKNEANILQKAKKSKKNDKEQASMEHLFSILDCIRHQSVIDEDCLLFAIWGIWNEVAERMGKAK
jgi:hypothetical protein